ncbi:hypothetical protein [Rhizobium leguminosarum]|uniref:hypothetical protein n=1 Tax=Rhizobium leguminosarum TaxID=384 RepID=UPI0014419BC9|nr:hypothetical protein [Rhizobium leguminosarum]NKK82177.1 hypothetical protein [Rhizobium leguminosarum bv. viciae]
MTEEKIDAFRRAYLRSVVDQVEVDDDEIRIRGRRDVLERLVMSRAAAAGVPSFVWKWRTGRDENGRRYIVVGAL